MNWIYVSESNCINLDDIFHVWIEQSINGYFLMGELRHNGEEVVISMIFQNVFDCQKYMHKILKINTI